MTQPAKAREPSMEEILASIRRIIADDDATQVAPAANDVVRPVTAAPPATSAKPSPVAPAKSAPVAPAKSAPAEAPPILNDAVNGPTPTAVNNQDDIDALFAALDAASADPPPPPPPPPPAAPSAEILELTDEMRTEPPPNFRKIDGRSDVVFKEEPEARRAALSEPAPPSAAGPSSPETKGTRLRDRTSERPAEHDDERPPLVSATTKAAVDSAFNALAQTVLVQNARTLEDLVREMLRPMLKSWLDDNLPQLVERLVRAEIERVSRGR